MLTDWIVGIKEWLVANDNNKKRHCYGKHHMRGHCDGFVLYLNLLNVNTCDVMLYYKMLPVGKPQCYFCIQLLKVF